MNWRITPLPLYHFVTPGPEALFQRRFGEMITLAIHAFLLEGPSTILVDTGLPDQYDALTVAMRGRKGPDAGFRLINAGLSAQLAARGTQLDAILLTSFGPYATGGLPNLGDIPVHGSARGIADLRNAEEPGFSHPLSDAVRDRILAAVPITDEQQILPGLAMVETGSHHPASATVIIETADGVIAIADPIFCSENLTAGTALGAAEDARAWYEEARRLAQRVDAVIPIHDVRPAPVPCAAWHDMLKSPTR